MFNRKDRWITVDIEGEAELARLLYTARRINRREGFPEHYAGGYYLSVEPVLMQDENYMDLPNISHYRVTIAGKLFRALQADTEKYDAVQQIIDGKHPVTQNGLDRLDTLVDA